MTPEQRAPGWQIRCRKCNFTQPYGKYGFRLGAIGTKYTFGRCPNCRRWSWAIVERMPTASEQPVTAS